MSLARQSGFTDRKARKLTPLLFVQATVLLVSQSVVSFRRWAVLVGVLGQLCLSKQALWERITPRAVAFLQAVLAHVLPRRAWSSSARNWRTWQSMESRPQVGLLDNQDFPVSRIDDIFAIGTRG